MAKYVLTDCKIYVDDYNISGDSNSGTLELTTPALDASTFSSVTARTKIPGLSEMKASIGVLYDATTAYIPDDEIDTWKGGMTAKVVTICPTTGATGEVAYSFKGLGASYSQGGSVGEVKKGTWNIEGGGGTGPAVRGNVISNVLAGVTGNGNGTSYEYGLLGTGHTLYSIVHLYSIDGGSLFVNIYSDDHAGMTSSTIRITGGELDETTTVWQTLAGPVATDTWWRSVYTYDGTLAKFVHVMAIV